MSLETPIAQYQYATVRLARISAPRESSRAARSNLKTSQHIIAKRLVTLTTASRLPDARGDPRTKSLDDMMNRLDSAKKA
jgi:hypothetical protein